MQKHLLYINLFTITSALALAACADEVDGVVTPDVPEVGEKTPIELTATNSQSLGRDFMTRAVIIDGQGKVTAFEKDTRLTLMMINEDNSSSNAKYTVTFGLAQGSGTAPVDLSGDPSSWALQDRYSNISFNETSKTVNQSYIDPNIDQASKSPSETNSDGSLRYWDDTYARKSQLSIYGFAINGTILPYGAPWHQMVNGKVNNSSSFWDEYTSSVSTLIKSENSSENYKWIIGDHYSSYNKQTFASVLYKDDICYSNNISQVGGTDNRLKFGSQETGKFDKGVIEFKRALSLITIKIFPGNGFDKTSTTNFRFPYITTTGSSPRQIDTGNIALKGFNKKGNLDIKTGVWDNIDTGGWSMIADTDEGNPKVKGHVDNPSGVNPWYTLLAFVIPGTDIKNSTEAEAMVITIDNNTYKVSMKALYDAIAANAANCESEGGPVKSDYLTDNTKLKAGINYEFTFTIGKTAIDKISASVIDWKTVSATAEPDNAHPLTSINMEIYAGTENPVASYLYKSATSSADLTGVKRGYGNGSDDRYSLSASNNPTIEGWYWPNNNTYYHLRTISPLLDLSKVGSEEDNYLNMEGGDVASAKDYVWGAPLKESDSHAGTDAATHPIVYNSNNGYEDYLYPAIGPTKSTIHVTQLHMMTDIELKLNTTITSPDAVTLAGAKVELVNYANQANLMIGTGLVNGWSDKKTSVITYDSGNNKFTWRTVPQSLHKSDTDIVGMKITLTDGNIYEIKDLSLLKVTVSGIPTTIPFWEPGKKYVYTLTLKKTAIDNIQATVVDWDTIEASNDNIQIQ